MTKKMVKNLMLVLTMVMLCFAVAMTASAEERTVVDSGECGAQGDNVIWTLYDDGELVICGEGEMEDYYWRNLTSSSSTSAPWRYRDVSVSTLTLKEGITTIGGGAFEGLSDIKDVIIPSTVTDIKWRAFYMCDSLETVTIGASVGKIYLEAFWECSNLLEFIVADNDGACSVEDGVLFNKDKTELLAYPAGKADTRYIIPDGVKVINNTAFQTAMNLQEVVIPDSVTEIDKGAFVNCESLVKVNLPDGLTKIDWGVFSNCYSLEKIDFPESLEEIGLSAFENCISLKEIILTDNITSVAYSSFIYCVSVEKIVFGDKIKVVPFLGFAACEQLKTVTFGKNIKKVCAGAFYYCPALEEIIISDENKHLVFENGALYNKDKTELIFYIGNEETTEFTIPDTVKEIQEGAFLTNMHLESVTVPEGIKTIPMGAFMECAMLKEVNLPETLEKIEWNAFDGCSSLESISIPDNVVYIGNSAFNGCSSLEKFNIPVNLEKMGSRVFYNSKWYKAQEAGILYKDKWIVGYKSDSNFGYNVDPIDEIIIVEGTIGIAAELSYNVGNIAKYGYIPSTVKYISLPFKCFNEFSVSADNPYYTVENNMLFTKDKKVLLRYADDERESVIVPEGVIEIAEGAFGGAKMKSVQLPASLKVIGVEAFNSCYNLESVIIPEGVEEIKNAAFEGCGRLAEISVPSTVQKMGGIVFYGTSWERNLPYGEIYIGNIFYDYKGDIPEGYNLVIKDGTTSIAGWNCMYQLGLKSIEMPDTVIYIGDGAFGQALSLTKVRLSKNLKEIGNGAFVCTSGISEIVYDGTKADWDKIVYSKEVWEDEFFGQCCLFYDGEETVHEHAYSETITEPTCTEKGEKHFVCNCGDEYTEEIAEAGHSFTKYESNSDATCIADGTRTAKCDNCDEKDTVIDEGSITPDEHKLTEWETVDNTQSRYCLNCNYKESKIATESGDVEIIEPTDPNTEFTVDVVTDYVIIEEALTNNVVGDWEVVKAFDITLKNKDGVHVQPDGTVKVKLPLHSEKDGVYKVYRVNEDGTLTDMNAYRQGSHMVFETDHFSIYVIVDESEKADEPVIPDEPVTPDEPSEETKDDFFSKIFAWFNTLIDLIFSIFK